MMTPPSKARIVAESGTGPAAAEVRAETLSGETASILLEALAGNAQASILLTVSPDGRGGAVITAAEVNLSAETLSARADAARLSCITAQLAADKAGVTLADLAAQVTRTAKLAFASLKLAAVSALIAAERRLTLRARMIELKTDGGEIRADATRIELNAPQGQLGTGGLPVVTQLYPPTVMVDGVPTPVMGLKLSRWRAA